MVKVLARKTTIGIEPQSINRKKLIMLKKTIFVLLALVGATAITGLVADKLGLLDD